MPNILRMDAVRLNALRENHADSAWFSAERTPLTRSVGQKHIRVPQTDES